MPITAAELSPLFATAGPPELGPGPRKGVLPLAELEDQVNKLLPATSIPTVHRQLVKAIVYLWHDHLDPAHSIAQDIATTDGSYVHGIVHRREPDFGNARYWFHRVRGHPIFPELTRRATDRFSTDPNSELQKDLLPAGTWNALAFIDACERSTQNGAHEELLRQLQVAEFETLLKYCLER